LFLVLARVPSFRWKAPAVLLVSVLPWLAGWQIRNWAETGFAGFSSIVNKNLYFYNAADVVARAEHRPFAEIQSELGAVGGIEGYLRRHPEQAGWNQAKRIAFMGSEAARIMRAHSLIFLRSHLAGSMRVVFTPGTQDLMEILTLADHGTIDRIRAESHDVGPLRTAFRLVQAYPLSSAVMAVLEIVLLALYCFAARGVARGGMHSSYLWLLLGVLLYFVAVSGGAQGGGRYRLPIMPVICILAAAGVRRRRVIALKNFS
jgi:hypothetical protein